MIEVTIDYSEAVPVFDPGQEKKFTDCITNVTKQLMNKPKSVNLLFCDSETIRRLNQEFRNKNKPTDILSFAYDECEVELMPGEPDLWGDLALCTEVCEKQAHQSGWDIETEIIRLLIHGLAHLAGYDHQTPEEEKKMLQLETELLSQIGFDDIYNQID